MDVDGCIYTDLEPTQELFETAVLLQPLEKVSDPPNRESLGLGLPENMHTFVYILVYYPDLALYVQRTPFNS